MTAVLHIAAFLCLSALLALRFGEELVGVLPVAAAVLILALYVCALFRLLGAAELLGVLCVGACLWAYFRRFGRGMGRALARRLLAPRALAVYVMLAAAFFLMRGMCLTNRDDLGFWAIEAKSVWACGGFAPRYRNVAASYGRYFPGTTLFRWWVCRLAGGYAEGVLAVGSAWLFVLLLAPILLCFSFPAAAAPAAGLVGGGLLLLLPGVFDSMPYQSICAEPLLSAAAAGAWFTLFSKKDGASGARLAAYGVCLCFFKAAGLVHALSIVAFLLISRNRRGRIAPEGSLLAALPGRKTARCALLCLVPAASWYIYCAAMGRSDYFTVSLAGDASQTAARGVYVRNLALGLFTEPAHFTHDGLLDLPILALLLLLALAWLAARRLGVIGRGEYRALGRWYLVVLAVFFTAFLLMHCFVFQEAIYLEAASMIASCARYGEPIFLGAALFLLQRFTSGTHGRGKLLVSGAFLALALLCTCLWTVWYRVIDKDAGVMQAESFRAELAQRSEPFLARCAEHPTDRILFVYGEDFPLADIERTSLQFLAAPHSLVFVRAGEDNGSWDAAVEALCTAAADTHPGSLYCTGLSPDFLSRLNPDDPPAQGELLPIERLSPLMG